MYYSRSTPKVNRIFSGPGPSSVRRVMEICYVVFCVILLTNQRTGGTDEQQPIFGGGDQIKSNKLKSNQIKLHQIKTLFLVVAVHFITPVL